MTDGSVHFGDATPQNLAQRAVDMFLTLVRRGTALAVGTLAVVSFICIGSFLLGLAALSEQPDRLDPHRRRLSSWSASARLPWRSSGCGS